MEESNTEYGKIERNYIRLFDCFVLKNVFFCYCLKILGKACK